MGRTHFDSVYLEKIDGIKYSMSAITLKLFTQTSFRVRAAEPFRV
ncbi:MAG: hypothetical protein ACTSUQ_09585 [Candidatus Freyarchaeota archaeon]